MVVPTDKAQTQTARADVERVASAFDYVLAPRPASAGVFVLCKRYTDPRDIPAITFEEAVQTFTEAELLLANAGVRVDTESDPSVQAILATLTPEQTAQLPRGIKLGVKDWSPALRTRVVRFSQYVALAGGFGFVTSRASTLRAASKATAETKQDNAGNAPQWGVTLVGPNDFTEFLPLSNPTPIVGDLPREVTDSSLTSLGSRNTFWQRWNKAETVRDVAAALNATPEANTAPVMVAPALLAKPLTLAGAWRARGREAILRAVAEAYDLRVRGDSAGALLLRRRPLSPPTGPVPPPRFFRSVLPLPLRRALLLDAIDDPVPPPPSEGNIHFAAGHGPTAVSHRGEARERASANWLAQMKQEKDAAKTPLPTTVADWDEAAKTCLAIHLIARGMNYGGADVARQEQPLYIASPELIFLKINSSVKGKDLWTRVEFDWHDPVTGSDYSPFARDQRIGPVQKP